MTRGRRTERLRCTVKESPPTRRYGTRHPHHRSTGGLSRGRAHPPTTPNQRTIKAKLSAGASIATGGFHTLALKTDGAVWAFGTNTYGQLGRPGAGEDAPEPIAGLDGVRFVAAGGGHSVVLRNDGTVWTFGNNDRGQLGRPTPSDSSHTPGQVPGLGGVRAVAAGENHTVVLRNDGSVWTFGGDSFGQLGRPTAPSSSVTNPLVGQVRNPVSVLLQVQSLRVANRRSCSVENPPFQCEPMGWCGRSATM